MEVLEHFVGLSIPLAVSSQQQFSRTPFPTGGVSERADVNAEFNQIPSEQVSLRLFGQCPMSSGTHPNHARPYQRSIVVLSCGNLCTVVRGDSNTSGAEMPERTQPRSGCEAARTPYQEILEIRI